METLGDCEGAYLPQTLLLDSSEYSTPRTYLCEDHDRTRAVRTGSHLRIAAFITFSFSMCRGTSE